MIATRRGIRKDQRRLMAGYVQLVDALHTLKISRTDVRAIVDIVSPYLGPASEWLDIERPGPALARAVPDDEDTD